MGNQDTLAMFDALQQEIGYQFNNPKWLLEALTHKSGAGQKTAHYERLEFLGDRILGQAVSLALFKTFPDEDQGALTKRFHALVRQNALAKIAFELSLSDIIITDATKQAAKQESVLSDVVEALIAALYLDGGQPVADAFIERYIDVTKTTADDAQANPKSALQEWSMARQWPMPSYQMISNEGPAHAPVFIIEVSLGDKGKMQAQGASKKEAEQKAARALLSELKQKEQS